MYAEMHFSSVLSLMSTQLSSGLPHLYPAEYQDKKILRGVGTIQFLKPFLSWAWVLTVLQRFPSPATSETSACWSTDGPTSQDLHKFHDVGHSWRVVIDQGISKVLGMPFTSLHVPLLAVFCLLKPHPPLKNTFPLVLFRFAV